MLLNVYLVLYRDAANNGDRPFPSHKLTSASELSKHLTTSKCPSFDATNNGNCPSSSCKLMSAPELSKHLTTSQCLGNLCIVKALLRNHADINKCNNWNTSPLNTASNSGHIDVVEYLPPANDQIQ
jgi:hypothetical protein